MDENLLVVIVLLGLFLIVFVPLIWMLIVYPSYKCRKYAKKYPQYFDYMEKRNNLYDESFTFYDKNINPIKRKIDKFEESKIYYTSQKLVEEQKKVKEYKIELEALGKQYSGMKEEIKECCRQMEEIRNNDAKFKKFEKFMIENYMWKRYDDYK